MAAVLAPALFTALLGAALLTPATSRAESVREVAARVHEAGGYDDRLRVEDGAGGPRLTLGGPPGQAAPSGQPPPAPARSPSAPLAAPGLGALSYVLLGLAILVVMALLLLMLTRLRPPTADLAPARPGAGRASPPASALPGRGLVDAWADPEALAAQGRFAEAIAAALLGGLRAVGWRPAGAETSRTAREILASVPAHDPRRAALSALVKLEERVAFGGDEASEDRWHEARERWRALSRESLSRESLSRESRPS